MFTDDFDDERASAVVGAIVEELRECMTRGEWRTLRDLLAVSVASAVSAAGAPQHAEYAQAFVRAVKSIKN